MNSLESLHISGTPSDILIPVLIKLAGLPRLFSLSICTFKTFKHLHEIYQLILALPNLKSSKISGYSNKSLIQLPMATNEQRSTIEYFSTDHHLTLKQRVAFLSYTPQLRRLYHAHTDLDTNFCGKF
ncbi:unnamed protein product [Rotaria sp. Silwood2]|nr:unnamed protein product [Rotaria sp. Silwood2]CAF2746289.1 unnamed protein product [Rotaria sp. Silwood2]CAF3203375.1 unnamed protein product [Rotaria sp. Silwood2]CAF4290248.1 unnamed protein product [Rotaria sp. Silwood2]CAF4520690.1 unnamed protein product [Rotaria sp. Silwood2]